VDEGLIEYRASHDLDLVALAALLRTAGWEFRASDPVRLAEMVAGSKYISTAHDGTVLVGFARAISDGVSNAFIASVCVLPEYRRRGIGGELVRRLMEGRDTIRFVLHAHPDKHGFYKALGFEDAVNFLVRNRRS
jgi:ribosomal protein S18 acetylase RimI-like enzyme